MNEFDQAISNAFLDEDDIAFEAAGDRHFEKSKESIVQGITMIPNQGVIVKLTKGQVKIKLGQTINDDLLNQLNMINHGVVGGPNASAVKAANHPQLTPGIHVRDWIKPGLTRKHSGKVTEIKVDIQGAEKSIPITLAGKRMDTFIRMVKWIREVDGPDIPNKWSIRVSGLLVYSAKMHLLMEPRELNTRHPKSPVPGTFYVGRANFVGSVTLYEPKYFDKINPHTSWVYKY